MTLLDQLRQVMRLKHYSYRTEQCYASWVEQYIRFHKRGEEWRHPPSMGTVPTQAQKSLEPSGPNLKYPPGHF